MARFWPKWRYNGRVMAREVFFHQCLWVTKFCAKFGRSRIPRTARAPNSFIILRCMWKEPAPLLLRWDLSTTRVTLTTFLTSRSHLVSWDLRWLVNRKKDFFSVRYHRHNQQNPHHNHYQSHHVLGVDGPVNQEEAKESKSKDWMFINYTFKRFPLMLFMQMFMMM